MSAAHVCRCCGAIHDPALLLLARMLWNADDARRLARVLTPASFPTAPTAQLFVALIPGREEQGTRDVVAIRRRILEERDHLWDVVNAALNVPDSVLEHAGTLPELVRALVTGARHEPAEMPTDALARWAREALGVRRRRSSPLEIAAALEATILLAEHRGDADAAAAARAQLARLLSPSSPASPTVAA